MEDTIKYVKSLEHVSIVAAGAKQKQKSMDITSHLAKIGPMLLASPPMPSDDRSDGPQD